jgi:hypothetical protein
MSQMVTQAEFARIMGYARSYVTQLKKEGRLVLSEQGLVDVEASKTKIAATADPNREDVSQRHQKARDGETQKHTDPADKIGNSFQTARAVKERYLALNAKLDYEKQIGELVSKAEMQAAVADVVTTFRQGLENMPHRVSAELVGKDINEIRIILKQAIQHELANMERNFTEKLNQPSELAA